MITHTDDPRLLWYVAAWVIFCLAAIGVLIRDRASLRCEWFHYGGFLAMGWKVAVFIPAFLFVTFAGRFTHDETWDVISGGGMAILTYLTAPWCLGVFYQVLAGLRPRRYWVVALSLLFFSSSWFYDGYILLRDGSYTTRWWSNLMLSPWLYLAAGCLWNLELTERGGVRLGFLREDWPCRPAHTRLLALVWVSIPLILVAVFILTAFVRWKIRLPGF